jgi:hypothetical protein
MHLFVTLAAAAYGKAAVFTVGEVVTADAKLALYKELQVSCLLMNSYLHARRESERKL